MSKKKLIIIVAAILIVVAIGVGAGVGISNSNKIWFKAHVLEGPGGFNSYHSLVRSYEDLPYNIGDEYDEEYFTKKAVIIITYNYIYASRKFTVKKVYKKEGILYLDVGVEQIAHENLYDCHWEIIVEVKQSDIKDVTEIKENFIKEN